MNVSAIPAELRELPQTSFPQLGNAWTEADAAELDVLVWALAFDYWEHRQTCEACQPGPCPRYEAWLRHKADCKICEGLAPLTFGWDCRWRHKFLEEHHDCVRCLPCPQLVAAIREVVDWRQSRQLLSRAEALRAKLNEEGAA